jgi:hypothetical protein
MARREISILGFSFLDAMTCGFGAVVLLFMVINASVDLRATQLTSDLRAEADRLEEEVLDGHENLVELRNSLREIEDENVLAQGLSRRMLQTIEELREELATYDQLTLARREHINQLMTDLKSLDESTKRLSGGVPSDEVPGDRIRTHIGDGDRQYLTGLKVGGNRIFILVDSSASMLDETIVNIIRRRNLPDARKIRSRKWQQAVSTIDWVTTQIPRESSFQLYTFNEEARPLVEGSEGQWLDAGDAAVLDEAVLSLKQVVPGKGTNLYNGFRAAEAMQPPPDNLILLVDGLPTQGRTPPKRRTVSGRQRAKLFRSALERLPRGVPVNVILFPMEGDPAAPSAYWQLALSTRGAFLSPSGDWP